MSVALANLDLLVHVPFWDGTIGANLGKPEYSYYFVYKTMLPLLEAYGTPRKVERLEYLDAACAASRAEGRQPLVLVFAPPHQLPLDPPAPIVPIFAWEFDTIPGEHWDDDPRHNWVEMLRRVPVAITHSGHTCDVVRGVLGADYPIHAIPAPVWDRFSAIGGAGWDGSPRQIRFRGAVLDTGANPSGDNPSGTETTGTGAEQRIELSGVVFTTVLNPHDGRKNFEDMVTAFVWAFRETPEATLVLKLIYHDAATGMAPIRRLIARLGHFRCRIVAICAFMDDDAFDELVRATAFAVNASKGEGQCLPLTEFMSAGRPAIAPPHTAMADYVDAENSFLLDSSLEWTIWPQDTRRLYRCRRHRLDWDSLRRAYLEAHRVAVQDPGRYREMSRNATNRLRAHCSTDTVVRLLRRAIEEACANLAVRPAPVPEMWNRAKAAFRSGPGANDPGDRSDMVGLRDAWLSGWFRKSTGELFEGFAVGASDTVVDVGCGDGSHLNFCALFGARIVGVDVDPAALGRARGTLARNPAASAGFLLAEAERLPLASGAATRVICSETLEHVDDPARAVAELYRIGAPGALYLITVPDALSEEQQRHVAPPAYFEKPNHIRIFPRDALPALLKDAGLELLSEAAYGYYWSIWWALFWACDVKLENPDHPALHHWAKAWSAIIETPGGRKLKDQLDRFMPKSRVYVARKPESGPCR